MAWSTTSEKLQLDFISENESDTGESYKKMLRYFLFFRLQKYSQELIFQQDGALLHEACTVRN